ncbi:hypothetical protein [Brevibacillus brevis]|uniref:hypothetical protein n=1 Tax=Brevibacillus brevis TaxID=1393 RepID=UPI0012DC1B46|nr:hypothetical protein [Brevibacillus brevis]
MEEVFDKRGPLLKVPTGEALSRSTIPVLFLLTSFVGLSIPLKPLAKKKRYLGIFKGGAESFTETMQEADAEAPCSHKKSKPPVSLTDEAYLY